MDNRGADAYASGQEDDSDVETSTSRDGSDDEYASGDEESSDSKTDSGSGDATDTRADIDADC